MNKTELLTKEIRCRTCGRLCTIEEKKRLQGLCIGCIGGVECDDCFEKRMKSKLGEKEKKE